MNSRQGAYPASPFRNHLNKLGTQHLTAIAYMAHRFGHDHLVLLINDQTFAKRAGTTWLFFRGAFVIADLTSKDLKSIGCSLRWFMCHHVLQTDWQKWQWPKRLEWGKKGPKWLKGLQWPNLRQTATLPTDACQQASSSENHYPSKAIERLSTS